MTEKLLTLKEASKLLGISPEEMEKWVQEGRLPAFQIGGQFLRFRRGEIERFRRERILPPEGSTLQADQTTERYTFFDALQDFFYFNDFYLICLFLAVLALWAIFTL